MYPYLLRDLYIVASLFLVAWRYAAIVEAPMTRLGLRMVSGTYVCAVGFTAIDLVYLLDGDLHLGIPGSPDIEKPLYAIGAILFITGVTLPAFGPRLGLEELWWSITRQRLMRQMRRVWKLVTDAYPSVVLNRDLLAIAPHGRRLAAERLPVEVHDGWLQLRHYLTTADVEAIDDLARQRGLTGDDHALIAAGRLMVALQRKNANAGPRPTAPSPVEHLGTGAHRTLAAEARFLVEVSKAIKSPFVRDVLRTRVTAWSLTGQ